MSCSHVHMLKERCHEKHKRTAEHYTNACRKIRKMRREHRKEVRALQEELDATRKAALTYFNDRNRLAEMLAAHRAKTRNQGETE